MSEPKEAKMYCLTCKRDIDDKAKKVHEQLKHEIQATEWFEMYEQEEGL